MESEYITRLIYEYNPHLSGKKTELPAFKRHIYPEILKWANKKQIIAITGLRRVGKSTLMKQIMQEMKNPVFFSFDEEETQNKDVLRFVIDFAISNLKSNCIFLDEVQYIKDWQGILKRYYDTKCTKFIISGSESLEIKKAKESLAGRIITFKLDPLSFSEYLELKGEKVKIREYSEMLTEKEHLEAEFIDYLYKGSFPEIVNEKDEEVIRKYINELVVRKIIYRDIPRIFDIKRRDLLFELFRYICTNSSNLFEINNLCNIFNADYETISNYIFYLKEAFLIRIAEVYSKSIAKRLRKNKKVYVVHPSIAFAVLGYKKEMLIEKILGQYVESFFGGEFFWRDKHKNEVDLIKNEEPIEVKYRAHIGEKDMKGLIRFMNVFEVKEGKMITRDLHKRKIIEDKQINFIPAWYFALK